MSNPSAKLPKDNANAPPSALRGVAISFASGALFGLSSVTVGQPLDTIKTRMQALPRDSKASTWTATSTLFRTQGFRGLYRGGMPLFVGGAMFRSAQFGCYDMAMRQLETTFGKPQERVFGVFDLHVIAAGVFGGLGRGLIEAPFEFVKVRRQVSRE
jgi:solute carrier family 25 carnitine/acylcarnitine transporter 20/29